MQQGTINRRITFGSLERTAYWVQEAASAATRGVRGERGGVRGGVTGRSGGGIRPGGRGRAASRPSVCHGAARAPGPGCAAPAPAAPRQHRAEVLPATTPADNHRITDKQWT